jgi:hypothetical protein
MRLIRIPPSPEFGDDDQSNDAGARQSNEVRVPTRDVARRVLAAAPNGRATAVARASVAVLLARSRALTTDMVGYDSTTDELYADGAQLRVRVERQPIPGLSWTGYYTAVAVLAFATIAAQLAGTYALSTPATSAVLLATAVLLLAGRTYQRYSRVDIPVGRRRSTE